MPLIIPPKHIGLSYFKIFQGLTPQQLTTIEPFISPIIIKANSPLLSVGESGDWVYFILAGTVRIYRPQRNGTSIILNMLGTGEVLGEMCALDEQGHSASALTTETTALYRMRRGDFCYLEARLPEFSKNIKHLLIQRLRFATTHREALADRKVHLRVARLLVALTNRYSIDHERVTVEIPLRLTQAEIAGWAGVSRQHAEKHLTQLSDAGIISLAKGRRVIVHDRLQLLQHCD